MLMPNGDIHLEFQDPLGGKGQYVLSPDEALMLLGQARSIEEFRVLLSGWQKRLTYSALRCAEQRKQKRSMAAVAR